MDSPVTHDLLYQSNGISGVGLIKEDNCVKFLGLVVFCNLLCLSHKCHNIFISCTTMYLLNNFFS